MRGPASAPLAFDSLAEPCPSSGGPRAAPTATCRRACVVPPRHRSPSTRSPAPVRPQADRALRRRSLVGAHAWSRLDAARLRLARRPLSVLRRTARCADGLSSARMRGPASMPLACDSLAGPCPSSGGPRAAPTASRRRACVGPPRRRSPSTRSPDPARPQADRALRRRLLVGAHAWSRLAPLAFASLAGPCPPSGGPRAAPTASCRRACVVPPRRRSPSARSPPLSVLRRTARCADGLFSARMRGPASTPLAFSSLAALSVLRRTARCADRLSSARMRGPASAPLAFDSLRLRFRYDFSVPFFFTPSSIPFPFPLSPVPICSILNHVVQELPGPATCPLKKTSG
jgi:hypothetical protein